MAVSKFAISYARANPNNPPLADLANMSVSLASTPTGLAAPEAGQATKPVKLGRTFDPPIRLRLSALRRINGEIVTFLNRRGLVGVVVGPSEQDLDPRTMKDLRPSGRTALRLVIYAARVTPLFGKPFRFSPQEPLGKPDCDLIAKTFFDMGRAFQNDRAAGEFDQTLMGWGVGVELRVSRYFSIRCDWAMALKDCTP